MNKLNLSCITLILFLTSCYSFNRIDIKPAELKVPVAQSNKQTISEVELNAKIQEEANKIAIQLVEEISKKNKSNCPVYTLPLIPKTPELPYKELSKIPQGNVKAMIELQQDHIEDLRTYIVLVKQIIQKSQVEYLNSCQIKPD